MMTKALLTDWLTPCFVLGLVASVPAQIVHVGGPLRPGEARPPLHLKLGPFSTSSTAPPYTPAQVRHAYGFDQLIAGGTTGAGQKIAIVDAYGSGSIQKDLNTFCSYFGIPSTTVQISYPQGKPGSNTGWAEETSLDVEWAHAIAPGATIVLVVARSASLNNLLGAVDYAVNTVGAKVVSMSWGSGEFSGETSYDSHFNKPGVTFFASAGDSGEAVEWPAAAPLVVGVGGTSLALDASGNYAGESAWSGGGGGISLYEALPGYQSGWQDANNTAGGWSFTRGVPDVSYLADPNTGVYVVYRGGLYVFGGTSVGAPQWAALVALSNSMRTSGSLGTLNFPAAAAIYTVAASGSTGAPYNVNPTFLFDVAAGSNGPDADDAAYSGYDLVTGVGSPVANNLAPALSSQ